MTDTVTQPIDEGFAVGHGAGLSFAQPRMRPRSRHRLVQTLLLADTGSVLASIAAAAAVFEPMQPSGYWVLIGCVAAWLISAGLLGGISPRREKALSLSTVVRAATVTLLLTACVTVIFPVLPVEAGVVATMMLTVLAGMSRLIVRRHVRPRAVIVTADNSPAAEGADSHGTVDRHIAVPPETDTAALLQAVRRAVVEHDAAVVKIGRDVPIADTQLGRLLWELRDYDVSVHKQIHAAGIHPRRVRTIKTSSSLDLEITSPRPPLISRIAKRLMDAAGASCLIAILSPLLVVSALLIKIDSRGPVLYRQERVGLDGRPFKIVKFRSMVVDADAELHQLLSSASKGDQPLFKIDDDPRVTHWGRIMRRYSIDELPQLLNVVSGTMSLVGPRPQRASEVALYDQDSMQRLGVQPGMTGWWQVSGRSRLSWAEAVRLDIYYAHNWSVWMDALILTKTLRAVIGGDGAQ